MEYPGSVTLKYHTFVDVLTQVASSVHAHGFRKILLLNGHGGNSPFVAGMRTKLQLYTVPGQVFYDSTRRLVLQAWERLERGHPRGETYGRWADERGIQVCSLRSIPC
jgi:creatinine amidohydrolase/Fe(II)-dependent formamide hydrolase-like protein